MKPTFTYLFFVTLFALCGSTISQAQVAIALEDLPSSEAVVAIAKANNPDISVGLASSEAQEWDFTNLVAESQDIVEFKNPLDTPYGDNYPLAAIARTDALSEVLGINLGELLGGFGGGGAGFDPIATAYYGVNTVTGRIFTTGIVTDIEIPGIISLEDVTFDASPPDIYLAAMEYGDSFTNNGAYEFTLEVPILPIPIPVTLFVDREVTADAHGSLDLPSGTFEVLRYHDVSNLSIELGIDLGGFALPDTTITVTNYRYLAKEIGYPVATLTSNDGKSISSIEYYELPNPNDVSISFEVDSDCLTINTSNTSEFVFDFEWDFGDGNTSALFQPEHSYEDAGTYTITLVGLTLSGDTLTQTATVDIDCPVSAGFVWDNSCLTMNFGNDSDNGASYAWDFGDGNTSTDENPEHAYDTEGTFTVTLTTTGILGDEETTIEMVDVSCPATAGFFPTANCLEITVNNFSDNAESYLWEFGDGNTSTEEAPVYAYELPGTYNISLTVTTPTGATDQTESEVTVDYCVGIEDLKAANAFAVYPNPSNGVINVLMPAVATTSNDYQIKIIDVMGRVVQTSYTTATATASTHRINTDVMPMGLYFITVQQSGEMVYQTKVLVK